MSTPSYAHLPVAVNATGEKLSKQTLASAVMPTGGSALLARAMTFLGYTVPGEVRDLPVADFWRWPIANWAIDRVPAVRAIFPGDDALPL